MSQASDFFGGGSAIPIGSMVMIPYKLSEEGSDDTNIDVLASYPENWVYPQGQILLNSEYPDLRALLNTDRIYEILGTQSVFANGSISNTTNIPARAILQSRFGYACGLVNGQGMKITIHDLVSGPAQIAVTDNSATGSSGVKKNFPRNNNFWIMDNANVSIVSSQWRNGSSFASTATVTPIVYPTFGSATLSTGTIAVAAVKHALGMYFLGSTIYAHMKYQGTLASPYARLVYKSTNNGTSWSNVVYTDTTATSISTVHNCWHDSDIGTTSLLIVSRGEMQTTFTTTGGTGTGAKVNVEGINSSGELTRVVRHPTNSNGSSGSGYVVGDVLTITNGNGGTATLRVDSINFTGPLDMTVLTTDSNWEGDTALVEVTAENTFTERLVLEDDNDAPTIPIITNYTSESDITITHLNGTYFVGTPNNLYYSTDKITWNKAVLPANSIPHSIQILEDNSFTVDHSEQVETAGYYTADVTDWTETKTRKHSSSSFFENQRGYVSGGTLSRTISSNISNSLYMPDFQQALDSSTEFQIPSVEDPGTNGMGAGIYPLMRLK